MTLVPILQPVTEEREEWVPPRPVTFEQYLTLFSDKEGVELLGGMAVRRVAAQLDHEKLFGFLYLVLGTYIQENDLGTLLGSRTAVEIDTFRGRLPDLLFVRRDREYIIEQRAIRGAPDLVIELISPFDRPSDLIALETDYRNLGVEEIVFIDQARQSVRLLHREEPASAHYLEKEYAAGDTFTLQTLNEVRLQTNWLFVEPRPSIQAALTGLLPPV